MGLRRRSAAFLAGLSLGLGGAGLVLPSGVAGQASVGSARFVADLTGGDGVARVTVDYELNVPDGTSEVTVELLGFDAATAQDFVVSGGALVVLWPTTGSRRSATVTLPASAGVGRRRLTLEYHVDFAVLDEGGALRARIPVLSVALPPATDSGDVFSAEVTVPENWAVTEAFPTGLREREPGVFAVALPVVPAVVSLRGRTDGAWRPGLPWVVNLLVAMILLGFGLAGWRYLREESR